MAENQTFDPNGVGVKGTLFGLPFDTDSAKVVVIPVPWDVTVSYGAGTSDGPQAIFEASPQIDYSQLDIEDAWKMGIAMAEIPEEWHALGKTLRTKSEIYIAWLEDGADQNQWAEMEPILREINEQTEQLMRYVQQQSQYWLSLGKVTVLLGGDHSTPLGHIKACAERYGDFGVLQIDAHADLRKAYEGFEFSHASIMTNVLKIDEVKKLVQVGIRDFCNEEQQRIKESNGRVVTFFDQSLKHGQFEGKTWADQCQEIIKELPNQVYISFDIDGLDPKLCPNTGTPVPGGFDLEQVMYLFKQVVLSGRTIIGCDLNEVAQGDDEWDANVGARALYRMINLMGVSREFLLLSKV
uniref:agmatinase family protein n=1 Tax=Roseivirga sp. TaxID=1964215 RepID=UPI0040482D3F